MRKGYANRRPGERAVRSARHPALAVEARGADERPQMRAVVAPGLAQDELDAVDDDAVEDVVRPAIHDRPHA